MDPAGGHNSYLRLPFTFPPETPAQLVAPLAAAWSELERHGPCDTGPLRPIVFKPACRLCLCRGPLPGKRTMIRWALGCRAG